MCIRDRYRTKILERSRNGTKYLKRGNKTATNQRILVEVIPVETPIIIFVNVKSADTNIPHRRLASGKWSLTRVYATLCLLRACACVIRKSTTSVSYTHLDVYKRQGCGNDEFVNNIENTYLRVSRLCLWCDYNIRNRLRGTILYHLHTVYMQIGTFCPHYLTIYLSLCIITIFQYTAHNRCPVLEHFTLSLTLFSSSLSPLSFSFYLRVSLPLSPFLP